MIVWTREELSSHVVQSHLNGPPGGKDDSEREKVRRELWCP
jgi:hypothetical protein